MNNFSIFNFIRKDFFLQPVQANAFRVKHMAVT